jgi:hypothetical protein
LGDGALEYPAQAIALYFNPCPQPPRTCVRTHALLLIVSDTGSQSRKARQQQQPRKKTQANAFIIIWTASQPAAPQAHHHVGQRHEELEVEDKRSKAG